ncbi:ubiquitin-conjugating enzyme E2 [Tupanvirus soda lake]|uniref:E2 ubiquitin-conjugating enzyme n=2 Tax=Tupanvirus TaxID=2094720 RepID=A0A6N1NJP6_9VIRU|nr:ubiquitin-conjugating enzyme E2 [Tupanvirus soda lake]QKU34985.1 ubiquitin-conjugating enzyme E2 [Tupanvirus soda lake]
MNKHQFHNKSHENTRGGFSRNSLRQNSVKFQNTPNVKVTNATSEINDWISKNNDPDIKIKSHDGNKIIMSMIHGQEHLVEITYPKLYPQTKKGFTCREIITDGITPIKFVKTANEQFEGKTLSIERVVKHLAATFAKYKEHKKNDTPVEDQPPHQVIFKPSANSDMDTWGVSSDHSEEKTVTMQSVTTTDTLSDNAEVEMINLEPEEQNILPDPVQDENKNTSSNIDVLAESVINENEHHKSEKMENEYDILKEINYQLDLANELKAKNEANIQMLNTAIDIELINKILQENSELVDKETMVPNAIDIVDVGDETTEITTECIPEHEIIETENAKIDEVEPDRDQIICQTSAMENTCEKSVFNDIKEYVIDNVEVQPNVPDELIDVINDAIDNVQTHPENDTIDNTQTNSQFTSDMSTEESTKNTLHDENSMEHIINEAINDVETSVNNTDQVVETTDNNQNNVENDQLVETIDNNQNNVENDQLAETTDNNQNNVVNDQLAQVIEDAIENAKTCMDNEVLITSAIESLAQESKEKSKIFDDDDRPDEEEIFDLGAEFVVRKTTSIKNNNKRRNKVAPKPQSEKPTVQTNKVLTDQDFDDFVMKNYKLIEAKHPDMEEDEIMDIIQNRWQKELKASKKIPQKVKQIKMEDSEEMDEKEPAIIKKSIHPPNNDSSEDEDVYDPEIEDNIIISDEPPSKSKNTSTNSKNTVKDDDDDDDKEMVKVDSDIEVDEKSTNKPADNILTDEIHFDTEDEKPVEKSAIDLDESLDEDDSEEKKPVKKSATSLDESLDEDDSEKENKKAPAKKVLTKTSKISADKKISTKSSKTVTKDKNNKSTKEQETCKDSKAQKDSNANEISYGDVEDIMGIYLDLSRYTKSIKLPFNMEKLYENAKKLQEEMDFGNSVKVKKSFSSASAIRVVMNEFKRIYQIGLRNNYSVTPINDNIYNLKLKFNKDFFETTSKIYNDINKYNKNVEIDIQIDSKLYPFYPPKVRLVTPRLTNQMNGRIATMECLLLSKWSPLFSIDTIITHFKNLMNQYAEIDTSSNNYDELENDLIELSLLSEIPARINSFLSIDELKNIKENLQNIGSNMVGNNQKKHWTSGTGYGHSGLAEWDIKSTMKAKEEHEKQLSKCIKNITRRLTKIIMNNINVDAVEIIKNSCYVPYLKSVFFGNNILELLKNPTQFELLMNSMRILTNKFAPIFVIKDGDNEKSLYEIFSEINKDCQMYLKTIKKTAGPNQTADGKAELDLVSNFVNFYKRLHKQIKELETQENNKAKQQQMIEIKKTLNETYKLEMLDEMCQPFEDMNIHAFEKLMRDAGEKLDTKFITANSTRQIAKELLSHTKSLPLDFGSSIFYRYNPNNLKYHEFIIAGPEGTPYDSGCFHFRMYCPAEYPLKNPKVNIYTTGNGTVRFNPNLYADGKVCLSLLGTWSAQAGESWIPNTSTMMQVMISIQSLVMIPDPYFNEPGYEREYGTEGGKKSSERYNNPVRLNCMKWAMINMMKNPTKGFESTIKKHFTLKAQYIKDTCAKWVSEAPKEMQKEFGTTYINLCKELDKLTGETTDVSQINNEDNKKLVVKKAPTEKTKKLVDV